ncbi:MAG: T9SS type A sorting domain-containing protein [Bacteroidota bacterium]
MMMTIGLQAKVIYVDVDATGSNTGNSWTDAFPSLQAAINNAITGDEIWVAEGLYVPDTDETGASNPTDVRTKTFYFTVDIAIYGGFDGTETQREDRDFINHICILSGDLDGDDTDLFGNSIAEDISHIQGDNSYHVMTVSDRGTDLLVDGFTFTAGKADNAMANWGTEGGGILIRGGFLNSSAPNFANCSFSGNFSDYSGGAISILANGDGMGNGNIVSPVFTNCFFFANNSASGSCIQVESANGGTSKPSFTNCIFRSNDANTGTSLCRAYGLNSEVSPIFDRCQFIDNEAEGFGGAFYIHAYLNALCRPIFSNTIISNNSAFRGGFVYARADSNADVEPTLVNCTIIANSVSGGGSVIGSEANVASCHTSLVNSIIYSGNSDPFYRAGDAAIMVKNSMMEYTTFPSQATDGGDNLLNSDPEFTNLANDDYTLTPCSPAVDMGDNTAIIPGGLDMKGDSRIINDIIDLGAFELEEEVIAPVAQAQDMTLYLDVNGVATLSTSDVDNGSSDNCILESLSLSKSTFDCGDVGRQTIELIATDNWGNIGTAAANITVFDDIPPQVVTKNIEVAIDENGNALFNAPDFDNGTTDNCSISQFMLDMNSFTCEELGDNVVTLTVTDGNGNSSSGTGIVTIVDNSPPSPKVKDITVSLDETGNINITADDIDNGSTDNCSIVSKQINLDNFDCSFSGIGQTVHFTVEDASGNTASATTTVTITDDTPPTVMTKSATVQLNEDGVANITVANINDGSFDNCAIFRTELDITQFDCENLGSNIVTFTVTDASGNTEAATAEVIVEDQVLPTVKVVDLTVELNEDGLASISPDKIDNGSFDNCSLGNMELDITDFDCDRLGTTMVTLTVSDETGNSATAMAQITLQDNILPTIKTQDRYVYLDENGLATIDADYVDLGSSDNCAGLQLSIDRSEFSCDDIGEIKLTLTGVDTYGNEVEQSTTLTVADDMDPDVVGKNININVFPGTETTIMASDLITSADDNCAIDEMTASQTVFTEADLGPQNVEVVVTDVNGNSTTITVIVTVNLLTSTADGLANGALQAQLFPNPVTEQFVLDIAQALTGEKTYVRIVNSLGQVVRRYDLGTIGTEHREVMSAGELASGLYYLELVQADQRILLPLVKH